MIDFISKVFSDRNYSLENIEDVPHNCESVLISRNSQLSNTEYFLLIQPPSEGIDNFIDELLESGINSYADNLQKIDPSFKKNCTLILLVQSGDLSTQKIKTFEEDPYVFKKNVLIYNTKQLKDLKLEVGESKFTNQYVSDLVFKEEGAVFESFKNNSIDAYSFYPLLMMILAKLPMITYHRTESSQLDSLDDSINKNLSKEQKKINNICLGSDISEMDDETVEKMVTEWSIENEL